MNMSIIGALGALAVLLGACSPQNNADKAKEATPIAASAPALAAPAAAIVVPVLVATTAQIDACKDSVLANAANNVTEQSARRQRGTETYRYSGVEVTPNRHGIWGGCKVALEKPGNAQLAVASATKGTLTRNITSLDTQYRAVEKRLRDIQASRVKANDELKGVNALIAQIERATAEQAAAAVVAPAATNPATTAPIRRASTSTTPVPVKDN